MNISYTFWGFDVLKSPKRTKTDWQKFDQRIHTVFLNTLHHCFYRTSLNNTWPPQPKPKPPNPSSMLRKRSSWRRRARIHSCFKIASTTIPWIRASYRRERDRVDWAEVAELTCWATQATPSWGTPVATRTSRATRQGLDSVKSRRSILTWKT